MELDGINTRISEERELKMTKDGQKYSVMTVHVRSTHTLNSQHH